MQQGVEGAVESSSLKPQVSSPLFYRVKLDVFEGPLDLLLHLVKKTKWILPIFLSPRLLTNTWAIWNCSSSLTSILLGNTW